MDDSQVLVICDNYVYIYILFRDNKDDDSAQISGENVAFSEM